MHFVRDLKQQNILHSLADFSLTFLHNTQNVKLNLRRPRKGLSRSAVEGTFRARRSIYLHILCTALRQTRFNGHPTQPICIQIFIIFSTNSTFIFTLHPVSATKIILIRDLHTIITYHNIFSNKLRKGRVVNVNVFFFIYEIPIHTPTFNTIAALFVSQ